ncbi:response regulator [Sphingomonas glacialis]|uniref:DNA-binding response regulator n=1 Tax=Sphingomonas glacialis TaxID=658225 RepID=A0A502FAX2_9SPHN|nr:response regulator transcription factor [Sphingomonas glacialis]TPG46555.1 DNA-binding response regulator [Sphingomonas glacialis]
MDVSATAPSDVTKVLIIDDDPIICAIATRILSEAGYDVICVANGEDAMDIAWYEAPDIVLLDCGLPGKPGMTLLNEFRASARFRAIPIVMMTSRRSQWSERIAREHGANAYIRKPFDARNLLIEVARVFSGL